MFRALIFLFAVGASTAQDVHVRVDANGPGSIASTTDYKTIQQALDHAPEAPHGRVFLHIAPGVYRERINVTRNRPRVTLLGEGRASGDVVITAAQFAKQAGGTFFTETVQVNGDDFEADNLTIENSAARDAGKPVGQAVAAAVRSDRAVFKRVRFLGDQDTLFADYGRQYYVECYVEGGVDFIFGNAAAVFDRSEIHPLGLGYLTAQSRTAPEQATGYVIVDSRVTQGAMKIGDAGKPAPAGSNDGVYREPVAPTVVPPFFFLGRPWRPYSRVVVMRTVLPVTLMAAGWSVWQKSDTQTPKAFYAEYANAGPGADTANRVAWSHQLTKAEAAQFEPQVFLRGNDAWDPMAAAARLP